MLRWFLGGRDAQSSVEVRSNSSFLNADFICKNILFITNTVLATFPFILRNSVYMTLYAGFFGVIDLNFIG